MENSRRSLHQFRLTIHELEQQLKQQTDQELNYLQMKMYFPRQTIQDDTQNLINILETRNQDKQLLLKQNEILLGDFHQKIQQQKQMKIKKEKDYQAMGHIEQELNQNLHVHLILQSFLYLRSHFYVLDLPRNAPSTKD